MPLHHPQNVLGHVLAGHKPRRVFTTAALCAFGFDAANAQALALAQGVKTQTHVLANGSACCVFDGARFFGNVAVQEISKGSLTNEANACGVFFLGIGQANFFCDLTDLRFQQFTHWKQSFGQLRLVQAMQKITLVFAVVQTFEQLVQTGGFIQANARVMARGYFFSTHLQRMV